LIVATLNVWLIEPYGQSRSSNEGFVMGADSNTPRGRYLVFQLADCAYAVPAGAVEEIVPVAELASVAGAPSFLEGFLDVGGELIAVLSLRRLLGLPEHEWELYTPLVILKSDRPKIAVEIDGVICVAQIDDEHLSPIAEGCSLNDYATAVARHEGRTVILLSPAQILLDQERRRLVELAETAQQRLSELAEVTA
jgi:purine-binding chemotaxis protein CheW